MGMFLLEDSLAIAMVEDDVEKKWTMLHVTWTQHAMSRVATLTDDVLAQSTTPAAAKQCTIALRYAKERWLNRDGSLCEDDNGVLENSHGHTSRTRRSSSP